MKRSLQPAATTATPATAPGRDLDSHTDTQSFGTLADRLSSRRELLSSGYAEVRAAKCRVARREHALARVPAQFNFFVDHGTVTAIGVEIVCALVMERARRAAPEKWQFDQRPRRKRHRKTFEGAEAPTASRTPPYSLFEIASRAEVGCRPTSAAPPLPERASKSISILRRALALNATVSLLRSRHTPSPGFD